MLTKQDLIDRARLVLTERGLSQYRAAKMLDVDRALITHAMQGRSMKTVIRIIEELGAGKVGYIVENTKS